MSSILDNLKESYASKKVLVVGLGLQGGGAGVIRFFHSLGSFVTVTDLKSQEELAPTISSLQDIHVTYHFGSPRLDDFLEADVIFKGPSVPWSMPELQAAIQKGTPVEMETSFFLNHFQGITVGVTGTRGKSTTSAMIYSAVIANKKNVYLAGNVPQTSTIQLLSLLQPDDIVILELSSWQLAGFHKIKKSPKIAVVTNLYPDHLNYYNNMDDYWYDKAAIFMYQQPDNFLLINKTLEEKIQPLSIKSNVSFFTSSDFPDELVHLTGEHNRENAAAAFLTAKLLKLDETISKNSISNFQGLSYRQQTVGEKNGIIFINDTTSTTPTATQKAIEAFSNQPFVILLGGNSKKLPYDTLLPFLKKPEKIILLPGTFTDEISPHLEVEKIIAPNQDFQLAVHTAYKEALAIQAKTNEKTYVLLSPGATSFAQFKNEFDRGNAFNRIVNEIIKT